MRTHLCGEVNEHLAGESVRLCGWVAARRDLGGLIFISLRDRAGLLQVVVEQPRRRRHQPTIGGDRHADIDITAFDQLVLRLVTPVHFGKLLHGQCTGLGDSDGDGRAPRF